MSTATPVPDDLFTKGVKRRTEVFCESTGTTADRFSISFTWTLKNYMDLARSMKVGESKNSPKFCAEDDKTVKWMLKVWPKGRNEEENDLFVSVFLDFTSSRAFIQADCKLSILLESSKEIEISSFAIIFCKAGGYGRYGKCVSQSDVSNS